MLVQALPFLSSTRNKIQIKTRILLKALPFLSSTPILQVSKSFCTVGPKRTGVVQEPVKSVAGTTTYADSHPTLGPTSLAGSHLVFSPSYFILVSGFLPSTTFTNARTRDQSLQGGSLPTRRGIPAQLDVISIGMTLAVAEPSNVQATFPIIRGASHTGGCSLIDGSDKLPQVFLRHTQIRNRNVIQKIATLYRHISGQQIFIQSMQSTEPRFFRVKPSWSVFIWVKLVPELYSLKRGELVESAGLVKQHSILQLGVFQKMGPSQANISSGILSRKKRIHRIAQVQLTPLG
ncbi:hypothetical protein B0H13DRAFT_1896007 [Mycena leptocephala]|nr:hypothetical protein B0H13DRAFT_1896007 [Mycena leptocephala]